VAVRAVVVASVLIVEALLRRQRLSPHGLRRVRGDPDLDQHAADGDVFVGHEPLGQLALSSEQLLRHVGGQQTLSVLRATIIAAAPLRWVGLCRPINLEFLRKLTAL